MTTIGNTRARPPAGRTPTHTRASASKPSSSTQVSRVAGPAGGHPALKPARAAQARGSTVARAQPPSGDFWADLNRELMARLPRNDPAAAAQTLTRIASASPANRQQVASTFPNFAGLASLLRTAQGLAENQELSDLPSGRLEYLIPLVSAEQRQRIAERTTITALPHVRMDRVLHCFDEAQQRKLLDTAIRNDPAFLQRDNIFTGGFLDLQPNLRDEFLQATLGVESDRDRSRQIRKIATNLFDGAGAARDNESAQYVPYLIRAIKKLEAPADVCEAMAPLAANFTRLEPGSSSSVMQILAELNDWKQQETLMYELTRSLSKVGDPPARIRDDIDNLFDNVEAYKLQGFYQEDFARNVAGSIELFSPARQEAFVAEAANRMEGWGQFAAAELLKKIDLGTPEARQLLTQAITMIPEPTDLINALTAIGTRMADLDRAQSAEFVEALDKLSDRRLVSVLGNLHEHLASFAAAAPQLVGRATAAAAPPTLRMNLTVSLVESAARIDDAAARRAALDAHVDTAVAMLELRDQAHDLTGAATLFRALEDGQKDRLMDALEAHLDHLGSRGAATLGQRMTRGLCEELQHLRPAHRALVVDRSLAGGDAQKTMDAASALAPQLAHLERPQIDRLVASVQALENPMYRGNAVSQLSASPFWLQRSD
jgi:hypothetical protein